MHLLTFVNYNFYVTSVSINSSHFLLQTARNYNNIVNILNYLLVTFNGSCSLSGKLFYLQSQLYVEESYFFFLKKLYYIQGERSVQRLLYLSIVQMRKHSKYSSCIHSRYSTALCLEQCMYNCAISGC